ncbi:RNA polymerase sigma factor, sigma-70 family [Prevotella dentalis DSM 3688]|uniref:RNA polymerase ECF-type sigma factor n=1 Tax=Prevotella dentalis (strain ATCC 49559 / DSM 3688 / JCM 13448 / NCTC 12043 / ES 2772) TaxID=908937 RepID=F9D5T8_PREDD|nr:sigma-70 family RNA polymerase sigma factor [Prevotella dentalis]AGB29312.1 RNA polymerase sigma factor, sigma-70 family [Prevotella dentalis DSM 3688]EGQ12961.1 RNA polymerase ECF-type sigma factor [Prevotella dentalis DSM 3688]
MPLSTRSDQQFARLFRAQYARLYYYAVQLTHDREAARDIVSDTFAHVWSLWDTVDDTRAATLLTVAVRRRCMDLLRHRQVEARYADYYVHAVDEAWNDAPESLRRQRLADRLMATLSEPTRTIMRMCYLEHRRYDEVAATLGVHHDTVKRHVMRALKLLRARFGEKSPDEVATESET